jgi:hypothetical protein
MRRLLIITIAAFALAGCNKQSVGRYQLHSGMYEPTQWTEAQARSASVPVTDQYHTVFLIDTATGTVWYAAPDKGSSENAPAFLPARVIGIAQSQP